MVFATMSHSSMAKHIEAQTSINSYIDSYYEFHNFSRSVDDLNLFWEHVEDKFEQYSVVNCVVHCVQWKFHCTMDIGRFGEYHLAI